MSDTTPNTPLPANSSLWADLVTQVDNGGIPLRLTLQDAFNCHGYDAQDGVELRFRLFRRASSLPAPDEDCPNRPGQASKRSGFTAHEAEVWKAAKLTLADPLLSTDANAVTRIL